MRSQMKRKVTLRYDTIVLTSGVPKSLLLGPDEDIVSIEQSSEMTVDGITRYAHVVIAKTNRTPI